MNLEQIRNFSKKKDIPIWVIAEKIGMSEQNLHRNIRINKIDAEMLEKTAAVLEVPITIFFDGNVELIDSTNTNKFNNKTLLEIKENEITMLKNMIEDKDLIISLFKEKDAQAECNAICAGANTA